MGYVNALMESKYPSKYYDFKKGQPVLKSGYSTSGGGGAKLVHTIKGTKAKYTRWGGGKDSYKWVGGSNPVNIYKLPEPKKAAPAPKPKPKPTPEAAVNSGPSFVGKNAAGQGLTAAEFDLYSQQTMFGLNAAQQTSIQNSINATSLAIQNLANEASNYAQDAESGRNVYSEDAASWRTQYSTDAQERWNKFDSAMDAKAITDSAKIQGEYSLDLAAIMRAGNEAVAGIQGEYSTANTRLKGEYDLASQKVSSAAARDVAQRNKEASMFGSFLSGFWS